MLYFLIIFGLFFHYIIWMWKKRECLHEKVRETRSLYTLNDELDFLSISSETDTNSLLGLHKSRPEYIALTEKRAVYFKALAELKEFQRSIFVWDEIDMEIQDTDDLETWNIKMTYRLGINRRHFFYYYPEYLRSIFGQKKLKTKPR